MSLISSIRNDPFDLSSMDLVDPFLDLGLDQPNVGTHRYRHHYHRHRSNRYRRNISNQGRGTYVPLSGQTSSNILPMTSTLKEDDNQYVLLVDIPGLTKEQCSIKIDNEIMTITATPQQAITAGEQEGNETVLWSERPLEATVRSIPVPLGVDIKQISAKEEHGVLHVVMPKQQNYKGNEPRRIEVS